jgi:hypothetical protein
VKDRIEILLQRALTIQQKQQKILKKTGNCLSEEELSCFIEGKCNDDQYEKCSAHLLFCSNCMNALADYQNIIKLEDNETELQAPRHLINKVMDFVSEGEASSVFDIVINIKEQAMDLLRTTGELLLGPKLVPVPVLRSKTEDRKHIDHIRIVKKLKHIIVEVEIEKKAACMTDLIIRLTEDKTKKKMNGIRVGLTKNGREIESLLTEAGKVEFEEVRADAYKLVILDNEIQLGSVNITIQSSK